MRLHHTAFYLTLLGISLKSTVCTLPFGLQVVEEDASFASDMMYDPSLSRLFITGGTYGVLDLSTNEAGGDKPTWAQKIQLASPDESSISCSAVISKKRHNRGRHTYLLAHSYGSASSWDIFAGDSLDGSKAVKGMVLDLTWDGILRGNYTFDDHEVEYPIAAELKNDQLFVATLWSDTNITSPAYTSWNRSQSTHVVDHTTAGGYIPPMFGMNFSIGLSEFSSRRKVVGSTDPSTDVTRHWIKDVQSNEGYSLQLSSSLIHSDHLLLLAGSTNGTFPGSDANGEAGSMDGFVVSFNTSIGEIVNTTRLSSSGMDRILGLCGNSHSSHFYAVGMTTGDLANSFGSSPPQIGRHRAFLVKMNSETMKQEWVYQIGALPPIDDELAAPQVHGIACASTNDGSHVYFAGNVLNGALLTLDGVSPVVNQTHGKDDIFLVKLDAENGKASFARQYGSPEDDTLANGRGLTCDGNDHAILLGNTKGSLFGDQSNPQISNIFIMSVDKNGDDPSSLIPPDPETPTATESPSMQPIVPTNLPTLRPSPAPSAAPTNLPSRIFLQSAAPTTLPLDRDSNSLDSASTSEQEATKQSLVIAAIVLAVLVAVSVFVITFLHIRTRWDYQLYPDSDGSWSGEQFLIEKVYMQDFSSTEHNSVASGVTLTKKEQFLRGEREQEDSLLLTTPSLDENYTSGYSSPSHSERNRTAPFMAGYGPSSSSDQSADPFATGYPYPPDIERNQDHLPSDSENSPFSPRHTFSPAFEHTPQHGYGMDNQAANEKWEGESESLDSYLKSQVPPVITIENLGSRRSI